MAKAELTDDFPLDEAFSRVLDDMVEQYGAIYPPPTLAEADELYLILRAEMRARRQ